MNDLLKQADLAKQHCQPGHILLSRFARWEIGEGFKAFKKLPHEISFVKYELSRTYLQHQHDLPPLLSYRAKVLDSSMPKRLFSPCAFFSGSGATRRPVSANEQATLRIRSSDAGSSGPDPMLL